MKTNLIQRMSGRPPGRIPRSSGILLGVALLLLLLHFTLWPLVWRLIFLPQVRPEQHRLAVDSSAPVEVDGTRLFLPNPETSVFAYAVWQVPQAGLYRIRLACDDNGQVLLDGRPVVSLEGVNANNVGVTKAWLKAGPHFLALRLHNGPGRGWLRLDVSGPGRLDRQVDTANNLSAWFWSYPEGDHLLSVNALSYLERDDVETWIKAVRWGEYLTLSGVLLLGFVWLALAIYRRRPGRLFPNRKWGFLFLGMGVLTMGFSTLYHTLHPVPPVWSDGLGHYAYLPAYLISHDLSLESVYQATIRYEYPVDGLTGLDLAAGEGFLRAAGTGRYLLKYPIGTALLEAPFFLVGHLLAPLIGSKSDGFSAVYQWAVAAAGVFYLLAGLVLLFKVLIRWFPAGVVTATLVTLFLGTNLLAYAAIQPGYSHIYSFSLVCLLLYITPRWYADPSAARTLVLSLAAGLLVLIRLPNLIFLLFVPLYGLAGRAGLKGGVTFWFREKRKVFLLIGTVLLLWIPQLLIWKMASGHFLPDTYPNLPHKFSFFSPRIGGVLFSFHHGLFIWSPVLLISVGGFWTMKGPLRPYAWASGICLVLHLYLVASWYFWFFGGAFGHRAFVDVLGMFALPLAGGFDFLRSRPILRKAVGSATVFLTALTFYLFCQALLGMLPAGMRPFITWGMYRKALVDTSGFDYLKVWLKHPQVNFRLRR